MTPDISAAPVTLAPGAPITQDTPTVPPGAASRIDPSINMLCRVEGGWGKPTTIGGEQVTVHLDGSCVMSASLALRVAAQLGEDKQPLYVPATPEDAERMKSFYALEQKLPRQLLNDGPLLRVRCLEMRNEPTSVNVNGESRVVKFDEDGRSVVATVVYNKLRLVMGGDGELSDETAAYRIYLEGAVAVVGAAPSGSTTSSAPTTPGAPTGLVDDYDLPEEADEPLPEATAGETNRAAAMIAAFNAESPTPAPAPAAAAPPESPAATPAATPAPAQPAPSAADGDAAAAMIAAFNAESPAPATPSFLTEAEGEEDPGEEEGEGEEDPGEEEGDEGSDEGTDEGGAGVASASAPQAPVAPGSASAAKAVPGTPSGTPSGASGKAKSQRARAQSGKSTPVSASAPSALAAALAPPTATSSQTPSGNE